MEVILHTHRFLDLGWLRRGELEALKSCQSQAPFLKLLRPHSLPPGVTVYVPGPGLCCCFGTQPSTTDLVT